jgi:hypothetical protein
MKSLDASRELRDPEVTAGQPSQKALMRPPRPAQHPHQQPVARLFQIDDERSGDVEIIDYH